MDDGWIGVLSCLLVTFVIPAVVVAGIFYWHNQRVAAAKTSGWRKGGVQPSVPHALSALREQLYGCPAESGDGPLIHRVVVEIGYQDKVVVVATSADGTVSYVGPRWGFTGSRDRLPDGILSAALQVMAAAESLAGRLPKGRPSDVPAAGRVRFTLVMADGPRGIEVSATELERGGHRDLGATWIATGQLLGVLLPFLEANRSERPVAELKG